MWRRLLLLGVVMGRLIAYVPFAHALVLCARQRSDGSISAALKVRETCKPAEAQLDPVALGLQGPQGPAGPVGPMGSALQVRDSNGALVGTVSDAFGYDMFVSVYFTRITPPYPLGSGAFNLPVVRNLGGRTLGFTVSTAGFGQGFTGPLFASIDCTGPPMIPQGLGNPYALLQVANLAGDLAYFAKPLPQQSGAEAFSQLHIYSSPGTCAAINGTFVPPESCCQQGHQYAWDADTFDLRTLGLVPPFHVEGP